MRYQLIMPYYNGDIVELIARNEMGYKTVVNAPKINSYLYVEEGSHIKNDPAIIYVDRETPYYDLKGRRMWKIETKQPTDVKRLRYYYRDTGEADIPFVRRVIIDLGITGAFNENLKPVKDWFLPPSICVIDIETLSLTERSWKVDMKRGQLAVAMIGMKFIDYKGNEENLQFILEPELKGETLLYKCERQQEQKLLSTSEIIVEEILEIHFKKEADLLRYFWMTQKKVWSDVITGWNVKFDTDYSLVRSWRLVDRYPELREYVGDEDDWEGSQEEKCKKFWANKMKILRFDLMNSYAELYKPKSKKLKYVAKYEEISDREHETGGIFHKLFWSNRKEAIRYNWDDVFDTNRINLKHDIIPYYWENKNMAGMETLEKSIKAGNLLDAVRLRLANNKVVLPTHSEIKEVKKIKGAEVFDPEKGVFYNVGTLDASRYYPSIILAFPELFHPITVQMVEWISKGRDVLEEKLEKLIPGTPKYKSVELRRDQRKFLLNAVYGDLADKRSRLYNRRMAGDITRLCREGINGVADLCKQKGLLVIQGDTDGLGIVLDTGEKNTDTQALVEKGLKLNKEINIFLQEFFQKAKNPERIKFKLEKIWQPFVSTDKKKMYFGRVIWQDGKEVDRVVMRGLRPRRRDSSDLTDRVVTKVCDLVLYEDVSKVIPYVREIVRNFTKIDLEELMISIGVNKPLKKYKVNTMHKRGSEYANDYIYEEERIMEGSRVFTMYCKVKNPSKEYPQIDVIAVELPEDLPEGIFAINRDKMLEKTVEKPLETVFDAIGLKWKDIKLRKNVKKLFARKPR